MAKNRAAKAEFTSFIAPERLYTYQGFIEASGISRTRLWQARRGGIGPEILRVGRRMFIRGADAIAFIERLAAQDAAKRAEEERVS